MSIEDIARDARESDPGRNRLRPEPQAFDLDEERRLATLESLHIVHTLPEDAYERIVRRASEFFAAPICVISMIGRDDQWFKAKVGVDVDLAPRADSFGEATFEQDGVYVVNDPQLQERFAAHPAVVGAPHIRFYAGVPLVIEGGHRIGTLSIADTRVRRFDLAAQDALKDFGALVVDELHLRLRTMRLEAQLERQRRADAARLAEQHERADFLAMVAHEVRAPLNAIAGIAGLIGQSGKSELDRADVDALQASTAHLVRMINEVLELARLEATGFTFRCEPFDLRREVHRALAVVQPGAAAKDVRLQVAIDAGVPTRVAGDRTRVAQIVMNLLTNAVKFTSRGSVDVTLSACEAGERRVMVTLRVADTGIGMSADLTRDLFKTFSQSRSDVRARYGGTGLGLAICRKLVTAMNGEISVESEPGAGTTFTCSIPFDVADEVDEPAPPANGLCRAAQLVLVADDDAVSARVTRVMLTRAGYRVETFSNGRDALAALRTRPFDIAILDLHMPDLDGFALADEMRLQSEFGVPVPLIALTGRPQPQDDPRVALFARYLVKPVDAATLDRAIVEILSMRDRVGSPHIDASAPDASAAADAPDAPGEAENGAGIAPCAPAAPQAGAAARRPAARGTGRRILLVEDNPVSLAGELASLRRMGFGADVARDGAVAVALFERHAYDLVLMDCHMPGTDGITATAEIRAIESRRGSRAVPVIAVTADLTAGNVSRCRAVGVSELLPKPFTFEAFSACVSRHLHDPRDTAANRAPMVAQWLAKDAAIDAASLDELRALADDEAPSIAHELVELFRRNAALQIRAMGDAIAAGDFAVACQLAHTLKSSSAYVGARGLSALMRQIEADARAKDTSRLDELARRSEVAFGQIAAQLGRMFAMGCTDR